ncbi:MAG: MarR family transcriptional regulator [Capsulimonas sp.]|uniref:MarR family winged helix-turn-helix transcriptional regulator n=1 Tax=Capsulimonas sp. TaxID=2494211 RepID=UPI003267CA25
MDITIFSTPGHLINRAARLSSRVGEVRLRPLGVSVGQLPTLGALRDGKTMTQKDLAALAHIEQPTMAQTLSRMERDGLIQRQTDPADKRSSLVRLTPEAMEKMIRVKEVLLQGNEEALEGFEETEKEMLVDLLRRVIVNLEAMAAREER